ncbi:putative nuclease HARBI1 [Cucumis melo var. makuwa]|uniref:Putative nuclease HARBI1 n=1 Tax=Cucumis melo var. makuwa TaxID=1194695 RepID=A0A5D3CYS0_CUCMM|nr:putative nuclease HARBI1 [Cucumis melo var. makuwa]
MQPTETIVGTVSTEVIDVEEMVAIFLHNCLGAFDKTYIKVNVAAIDRPRYRTWKDEVATNVLDVYDTKGDFLFILVGWKGFATISRPKGLKVPKGYLNYSSILCEIPSIIKFNKVEIILGYYYLCNVGYPNAEGFLALYRGQRYHL